MTIVSSAPKKAHRPSDCAPRSKAAASSPTRAGVEDVVGSGDDDADGPGSADAAGGWGQGRLGRSAVGVALGVGRAGVVTGRRRWRIANVERIVVCVGGRRGRG